MSNSNNITIRLNKRQCNWLAAFEQEFGRTATVTRKALLDIQTKWQGKTGPYGHSLRWPAWLTNSGTFTVQRAVYSLPWVEFDAFVAANGAQTPATPSEAPATA
jgi:hypothetical protein